MWSRVKSLFGAKSKTSPPQEDSVSLHLPLQPSPENAPKLAQMVVESMARLDGVTLDYSPASLELVDSRVLAFRAQGATSQQMPETLFLFGCYFGEVLNRHLGGQWISPDRHPAGFAVLAVDLSHGLSANPIGKVFKLLENGQEDSIAWLYQVLAQEKLKRSGVGDA